MPTRQQDAPTDEGQEGQRIEEVVGAEEGQSGTDALDEALAGFDPFQGPDATEGGDEETAPPADEGAEPTAAEGTAEGEGDEADASGEQAVTRYRDPDSGQFITAEEARSRGLEPEELVTEEEAADEFFGAEGEEEVEGEEAEGPEPLELELSEDERLELEFEDEETRSVMEEKLQKAERVEELEQKHAELEETRAEVEAARQAQEEFEEHLREDPVGFVLENMPDERKREVAIGLLYDDEVLNAVDEKFNEWAGSPRERELEKERFRRKRLEERTERQQTKAAERARAEKAEAIMGRLRGMVPEDMSPGLQERFLQDAVRDLQEHIRANEMTPGDFDLDRIPNVIDARLELYGIDPESVRENGGTPEGSGVTKAEPRGEDAERLAAKAEQYRQTGERLRKARARKKAAASSAPPGAGAGPTGPSLGSDATLDEALEQAEKRL